MRISADQLQERLEGHGLVFSKLELFTRGQFSPLDAEWNYKDIPHLDHVHELVDGVPAIVEDELISNFFLQRVGPLRVPLTVINYSASRHSHVYFTSGFFFVLIIETSWQEIHEGVTQVTTTYRIGSSRVLRQMHRLISVLLRKNYNALMKEDTPMRLQRGKLRARGLVFRGDLEGYSFLKTLAIHHDNVIIPSSASIEPPLKVDIATINGGRGRCLVGTDDHRGVQLVATSDRVLAFPRICPHEGASLDEVSLSSDTPQVMRCPWHGRQLRGLEVSSNQSKQLLGCNIWRDSSSVYVQGS